jgi:glycine dehydrogenase subunit 2
MTMNQEPLIYEISSPGRCGVAMPQPDVPETDIPAGLCRKKLGLPELTQIDVTRHNLRLSKLNYSIDEGFYPLGSCTMKYNPKINEDVARLPGFAFTHPLQDPLTVQGNLAIMFHLQEWLKEIGGFAGVTLQPAAGAHGEFTGILIMRVSSRSATPAQRDLDPRFGARHQSRLVGDERLRGEAAALRRARQRRSRRAARRVR